MRSAFLGLLGLALAVAVGFGVHLATRSTISLPVVQLEEPPPVAPARTGRTTATTEREAPATAGPPVSTAVPTETGVETQVETDDGSGRGRGRGRSGGDSGSSGSDSGSSGSGGGDD